MLRVFFLFLLPLSGFARPSDQALQQIRAALRPGVEAGPRAPSGPPCEADPVVIRGADPITHLPRQVHLEVFQPPQGGTAPTVLVFPPTGGENFFDKAYAIDLCHQGMRAAILQSWDGDNQNDLDLGSYNRNALRLLGAAEHALEFLAPRGAVGLLGTSLGAISGAFVMGYDERITTGVLIVGGANLPSIVSETDERGAADLRHRQMENLGLRSVGEFEAALRKSFQFDPANFADYSGAKQVLLYVGTQDTTVPTRFQYELAQDFGTSNVIPFDSGHVGTISHTFLAEAKRTVEFLKKGLGL